MQQGFPIILHSITHSCAGDLGLVHSGRNTSAGKNAAITKTNCWEGADPCGGGAESADSWKTRGRGCDGKQALPPRRLSGPPHVLTNSGPSFESGPRTRLSSSPEPVQDRDPTSDAAESLVLVGLRRVSVLHSGPQTRLSGSFLFQDDTEGFWETSWTPTCSENH